MKRKIKLIKPRCLGKAYEHFLIRMSHNSLVEHDLKYLADLLVLVGVTKHLNLSKKDREFTPSLKLETGLL